MDRSAARLGVIRRPPRIAAARARLRNGIAISALLHLLIGLAILVAMPKRRPPETLPSPSFAVVFEGGAPEPPSEQNPSDRPQEPAPEPAPSSPPAPPAAAALPLPQAPPPPPAPPPPQRLAELPTPPAPPPPQARAELPRPAEPQPAPPLPPDPTAPRLALPSPSPPAPTPQPAQPRPTAPTERPVQPPPDPAPPRLALTLPNPLPPPPAPQPRPRSLREAFPDSLDLTARPPSPATPPRAPQPERRPLDLSLGADRLGPDRTDPLAYVSGAQLGADWRSAFRRWFEEHKRYPREAIALGEQGSPTVRLVIDRDGRVRQAQLVRASRSFILNTDLVALFRGQTLPPFPPGTREDEVTLDFTLHYILLR